jgi:hypothetical protein
MPERNQRTSNTSLSKNTNIEELVDHMSNSKIGQTKDACMENLAASLSTKWCPNSTHDAGQNAPSTTLDKENEGHASK